MIEEFKGKHTKFSGRLMRGADVIGKIKARDQTSRSQQLESDSTNETFAEQLP
jgi:hypothetical protein